MKKIRKGVILASGTGSRMSPFTQTASKAMAPIYTKHGAIPQIQFPLEVLTHAGIEEILILVSPSHGYQIMEYLGDGKNFGCNITYKTQDMNREITGIAQALGMAREFTSGEDFIMILGDNYFDKDILEESMQLDEFMESDFTFVAKEVDNAKAFGVMDWNTGMIVEKPEVPPSNWAITGLYKYSDRVYDAVDSIEPSSRNELEITDVNNYMLENHKWFNILLGPNHHWQDMGTPKSSYELSKRLL